MNFERGLMRAEDVTIRNVTLNSPGEIAITATSSILIDNSTLISGLMALQGAPGLAPDVTIQNNSSLQGAGSSSLLGITGFYPVNNVTINDSTITMFNEAQVASLGKLQWNNTNATITENLFVFSDSNIRINGSTLSTTDPTNRNILTLQTPGDITLSGSTLSVAHPTSSLFINNFGGPDIPKTFRVAPTRPADNITISNSTISGGIPLIEGRQVTLNNAAITGATTAFVRSVGTVKMLNGSSIATTGGPVLIAVDSSFRHPLQIGTGSFQMDPSSSIDTNGGRLEIWTARQQFNNINGLLNGSRFTPGPLYVNSALEYWQVFFPKNPLSGIPFAIY